MNANLNNALTLLLAVAALTGCASTEAPKPAAPAASAAQPAPYAKPGFYVAPDKDGRLWVFPDGHPDHLAYIEKGRPAQQVRRISAGPQGQTLISTEAEHIDAYLAK